MVIYGSCPNCGLELEVHEEVGSYAIVFNGQAVTACPMCAVDLVYEEGDIHVSPTAKK